jgi:hypothetical protein
MMRDAPSLEEVMKEAADESGCVYRNLSSDVVVVKSAKDGV